MKYSEVHTVFFSPTHTSRAVAECVVKGLNVARTTVTDLTYGHSDRMKMIEEGVVVIAVPVYGGRVAETAMERLEKIKGNQVPAVLIVVYGNRDYEDALVELRDYACRAGFVPVAAAAFIGEHSYSRADMPIAAGRPDVDDREKAVDLGQAVAGKLEALQNLSGFPVLSVKGNIPYKIKGANTPATPLTREEWCIQCGVCVGLCPTQAIELRDMLVSDPQRCIKCCACVKACPEQARIFDTPYTEILFKNFSARREPEIFL
ncbi:MAG: 4Fe-4S binding protein [Odoribacter sp.]|nr:4Fe-4S binding protein [Odoribacter sp.]